MQGEAHCHTKCNRGIHTEQRVATSAPSITTTTNPTNPRFMATQPRTHLRAAHVNTPGITPTIPMTAPKNRHSTWLNPDVMVVEEATTPNSNRTPLHHPNMISQEAINLVTVNTQYGTDMDIWTPEMFLTDDTSSSHGTS